jgi:hypothetical protein
VLDQVDELLRAVLLRDVPELTTSDQIRFQAPDDDWRTAVANLGRQALSVYLVDLRENKALRDREWQVVFDAGGPQREVGPMRVDCHYLISAWSPATVTPAIEPTLDEHALLYRVLAALANAEPLNPTRVYPGGSAMPTCRRRSSRPRAGRSLPNSGRRSGRTPGGSPLSGTRSRFRSR